MSEGATLTVKRKSDSLTRFSILFLKFKSEWKFAAPLYAIYSFVMLSVSVYGYYKLPNAFFMLSVESLLVVSMALWFRSKFIVIMNGILYILLLVTYLSM